MKYFQLNLSKSLLNTKDKFFTNFIEYLNTNLKIYCINRCMTPENKLRLNTYETNRQKKILEKEQRYHIGKKQVDKK